MTSPAKWRITFPVTKAERRSDGLFLIGEATGPEVDAEKERMHPSAIEDFQTQITKAVADGSPLPYRDAHAKDGVLRDLGHIVKGWLTPQMHLGIEVQLDEDNPAAVYLFTQVQKGKKFGMSVMGLVHDYADEFVADLGHVVRTYKAVALEEISNTTRPAWTPSFGTVLSKAIDEAIEAESVAKGEQTSMDEELTPEQETSAPAAEAETTEKADEAETVEDVVEQVAEAPEGETAEKSAEPEDAEAPEEVEKAGRRLSAATAGTIMAGYSSLQTAMRNFARNLAELGVLDPEDAGVSFDENGTPVISDANDITAPEKSDSEAPENAVEKSSAPDEVDAATEIAELKKALAELTAEVTELRKSPATGRPPLIVKSADEVIDPMAAIAAMSPGERLRLGLAARHPGEPR